MQIKTLLNYSCSNFLPLFTLENNFNAKTAMVVDGRITTSIPTNVSRYKFYVLFLLIPATFYTTLVHFSPSIYFNICEVITNLLKMINDTVQLVSTFAFAPTNRNDNIRCGNYCITRKLLAHYQTIFR